MQKILAHNFLILRKMVCKTGKYVVVAHGTADEVANAKKIIEDTKAIESEVHHTEPVKV
jgi:hypothetical protein